MRPLVSIAAFALFLTVPLCAQRGGGHAGGFGAARGMSGAHMGGGHFSGGMHSGFSGGAHRSTSSANGFRGNHFGQFNVRRPGNQFSNCFGAFCGHPGLDSSSWGGVNYNVRRRGNQFSNCFGAFCGHDNFRSRWGRNRGNWAWGWGYYDPWLWSSWDYDDYRFDRDYYRERALAQQWNEQQLEESRMREEEAQPDRDENSYHRRSYSRNAQPVNDDQQSTTPSSPTVLIFRDQHQKEVTNYAIIGQNLLDLTPQHHEKIPLANLDLPATAKANDDRGVTFRVPGSQEGQ
ncbi:MAG: hypothetical protein ACJ713_18980 [Candidatus Sulfotelmatobacter sp.]